MAKVQGCSVAGEMPPPARTPGAPGSIQMLTTAPPSLAGEMPLPARTPGLGCTIDDSVRLPTTTTGASAGAPFDETERHARAAAMAQDKVPETAL
jgi:hypothetical protein